MYDYFFSSFFNLKINFFFIFPFIFGKIFFFFKLIDQIFTFLLKKRNEMIYFFFQNNKKLSFSLIIK
jgi:hypothetical protein